MEDRRMEGKSMDDKKMEDRAGSDGMKIGKKMGDRMGKDKASKSRENKDAFKEYRKGQGAEGASREYRKGQDGQEARESSKEYWKAGNMLYPVPAVMVSCGREGKTPNIITIAWAGTICSDPAMVSISVRKERYSHNIIKDTGEFVINLVNKRLVRSTDYCGVMSGRDVDKFKETRLTPQESRYVKAPGIKESPVNIECKVVDVKELGSHDMFIAKVLGVTIDNQYMDDRGKFNLNASGLVSYSHGEYFELGKKLGSFGYSVKKQIKKRKPVSDAAGKGTASRGRKRTSD